MLDWLIVGGGIHGTYLSLYLTQHKAVAAAQIRILDPQPQPLALWKQFTTNCGMEFLRSSHAHNLHFDPFSLVTFARTQAGQPLARFIEPYGRPSLELFNAHCERLIARYHLDELRLTGRAQGLRRVEGGWRVESEQGSLEARHVILAFGGTEQPYWPGWAREAQGSLAEHSAPPLHCMERGLGGEEQAGASIHHLFDTTFNRQQLADGAGTVVVGAGISAAQFALSLAVQQLGTVTLLMRHAPHIHQFDADLGWITYRHLDGFQAEPDYGRRRAMIRTARHTGSMPTDVARELERAVEHGLLALRLDEVEQISQQTNGSLSLQLASGEIVDAEQIVLATGFDSARPGGAWLDEAIHEYGLPCASDGYPIVDKSLCWTPGLSVCGALAELEVGPVARNLVGVKLAAERIGAGL